PTPSAYPQRSTSGNSPEPGPFREPSRAPGRANSGRAAATGRFVAPHAAERGETERIIASGAALSSVDRGDAGRVGSRGHVEFHYRTPTAPRARRRRRAPRTFHAVWPSS